MKNNWITRQIYIIFYIPRFQHISTIAATCADVSGVSWWVHDVGWQFRKQYWIKFECNFIEYVLKFHKKILQIKKISKKGPKNQLKNFEIAKIRQFESPKF